MRRALAACLAACACAVAAPALAYDASIPAPVAVYADFLARVRSTPRPAPVESLYALARATVDSLQAPPGGYARGNRPSILESMDDSTIARCARCAPGLVLVNAPEAGLAWALCDVPWFLALARERGAPADVAYFATARATYPDSSAFPVYMEQLTDEGGCTKFGAGRLVTAYARWTGYRERFPGRYADAVADEIEVVRFQLTDGTCACDDRASVVRELRAFVRRFPRADIAPRVRELMQGIESGKVAIREHCTPG
jgi:hypothetical protein